VGQPADRVAFAATGGMFNQVILANAFLSRGFHETANGLQLVIHRGGDERRYP